MKNSLLGLLTNSGVPKKTCKGKQIFGFLNSGECKEKGGEEI
jgi:hypothetical protein